MSDLTDKQYVSFSNKERIIQLKKAGYLLINTRDMHKRVNVCKWEVSKPWTLDNELNSALLRQTVLRL